MSFENIVLRDRAENLSYDIVLEERRNLHHHRTRDDRREYFDKGLSVRSSKKAGEGSRCIIVVAQDEGRGRHTLPEEAGIEAMQHIKVSPEIGDVSKGVWVFGLPGSGKSTLAWFVGAQLRLLHGDSDYLSEMPSTTKATALLLDATTSTENGWSIACVSPPPSAGWLTVGIEPDVIGCMKRRPAAYDHWTTGVRSSVRAIDTWDPSVRPDVLVPSDMSVRREAVWEVVKLAERLLRHV